MQRTCRFCENVLEHPFLDLGMSPLSNAFLRADDLEAMEPFYALRAYFCSNCFLAQLPEFQSPENIFNDYAYFSSYSQSWLDHAKKYAQDATLRFGLNAQSQVIEVASNDGYLLQYFQQLNVPVLGIEPAANVAAVAQKSGIPTIVNFLGKATASQIVQENFFADLVIGNNVVGHVPNVNDFVAGLRTLLKTDGVLTMEFPHVMRLLEENQFDTIYHEHFSYWSLLAIQKVFSAHDLIIFDVQELPTHGGSLRIFACPKGSESGARAISDRVEELRQRELSFGLDRAETYLAFGERVNNVKRQLLSFLIKAKNEGKSVVGYGAPAKGNTLLNYCGVRTDFLNYTVDLSPHKQGRFLPGTHIPIFHPDRIQKTKPDYLLILPWNLKTEIAAQLAYTRDWNCQLVVPIPGLEVLS
jgi:SAM-dependent methyltransferase